MSVPERDLAAYRAGELIQDALPSLSDDEREFLISGFCAKCFQETFGN